MSALRKQRLLREALGERQGTAPTAEGVLLAGAICAGLMALVLFVG